MAEGTDRDRPPIGAIILAAGAGRRMGAAKPAVLFRGRPLLAWPIAAARAAGLPLLLVAGAHRDAVRRVAGAAPVIVAGDWREGLAASIRAGLGAAPVDWGGALLLLGDMPLVRPETLALLAAALRGGAPAVVPCCEGRRGNPCGVARALWPELLRLSGDRGAKALLDPLRAREIAVADEGVLLDIDAPADLERIAAHATR